MSIATVKKPKLMTAEEFCDWGHRPEHTNTWFELTGEDVLPGFRCRVVDFFFLPGQEQGKAKTTRRRRRSQTWIASTRSLCIARTIFS